MEDFMVEFKIGGHKYHFFGRDIWRKISDGEGNKILATKCYDEKNQLAGVANLTKDWEIKSFYME